MERALWRNNNGISQEWKEYTYGYPWPPRHYTCSFCQREFKSAQALGGHMNIHRRDRARLRDHSPSPNPNPNPNPNLPQDPLRSPNPNPNTTNNNGIYTNQYSLVSLSLSSCHSSDMSPVKGERLCTTGFKRDRFSVLKKLKDISHEDEDEDDEVIRVLKSKDDCVVKLDLELGLGKTKEDLDLELRLGS